MNNFYAETTELTADELRSQRENFERTRTVTTVTYHSSSDDHGAALDEVMNRKTTPSKVVIRSTTVRQTVVRL